MARPPILCTSWTEPNSMIPHLPRITLLLLLFQLVAVFGYRDDSEPEHITAILGDSVLFNCHANFPDEEPVPYVVQWEKKGSDIPIFIWYDDYPTHCSTEFFDSAQNKCRVDKVDPNYLTEEGRKVGQASLNLTKIQEKDRGWYNCKVVLLNRPSDQEKDNGTWYHLSVHAPPHFLVTPEDLVYVNIGDQIILSCQAEGTPDPEILWYKFDKPVHVSKTVSVINDGTELRINNIRSKDLGDYSCLARNGEGTIFHLVKVVIAGGAIITKPPLNQTKTEGDVVSMTCEGEGTPGNLSIAWFRGDKRIQSVDGLSGRAQVTKEGTLVISPVSADDAGPFVCELTNGIGRPQRATAYLAVEYPARVVFTPTMQYLPLNLPGIIHCHIESNPTFQFITWTKDKRIFDPFDTVSPGIQSLTNGSLKISKVTKDHAGDYTCTPYNVHGTAGTSGIMQVHVRDPPVINVFPEDQYVMSVGDKVTMPCMAGGVPTPNIQWRRVEGHHLPKKRHKLYQGTLTIEGLQKKDHGIYECVVSNDVATLTARTKLIIEKTSPHAPHNVTVTSKETFAVTIKWLPGYAGCSDCKQTYKIRYREQNSRMPNWIELPVNPPDARQIQIHNLLSGTTYEFQVIGTNQYGDGMFSQIVEARTKGRNCSVKTNARKLLASTECIELNLEITGYPALKGDNDSPKSENAPEGQKPPRPMNLTVVEVDGGWVIRWINPNKDVTGPGAVLYYTIEKKEDSHSADWRALTDHKIEPEEASYLIKNMGTAKAYLYRVYAHSATAYTVSENFRYQMPANVKRRAITAGLIGGVLFFIVAIIVSVCTVKICNRRKRRKQEQALKAAAVAGTAAGAYFHKAEFQL